MRTLAWTGLGVAVILTQFAFAQQMPRTTKQEIAGQANVKTEKLSGTVLTVDGNKLVVRTSSGDIRYFEPPESRRFIVDGKELTVHQLKPGTKLTATVTTTTTPVTERTTTIGTGKVWFVSGNSVIITLPNNENRQYKVADSYRFTVDGKPASVHELRRGMTINAQKIVEEQKTLLASDVVVTGQAPPEPKPKPEVAQTRPAEPEPAAPAPAPEPAPAPAQVAQAEQPSRLPESGSPLPLVGAVGLLSIAASFGLRALRRSR